MYKVLEDFTPIAAPEVPDSETELEIKKGEHVNVIKKDISGWWFAQNEDGSSGWVPANYLEEKSKDQNDKNLNVGAAGTFFIATES